MDKIRLQVFLSRQGVCSRRAAMALIQQGHVIVNGQPCLEPSTPVEAGRDHVFVEGKRVKDQACLYVLLNKPLGYTTTKEDPFAERTVYDLLPRKFERLSPVGRLDKDTEGLLLLTNDGDTAYRLTHPKFGVDKIYFVRACGRMPPEKKALLERGVFLEGRRTAPAEISAVRFVKDFTELTLKIHEGRKRQVRRMFAIAGYKVTYLKRLAQGPLSLGALPLGRWRLLTHAEVAALHKIQGPPESGGHG